MRHFQKVFFLFICLLFAGLVKSQSLDTLRIMTYNLLNYRSTTAQCTNSNNNPTTKENALEIIIDHVLPDVLVCNEIGGSPNGFNAFTLMNSSLNQNGRTYYNMANYTTQSNQNITNMLYYDTNKLVLHHQHTINKDLNLINLVRLVDVYTLYYKDPNLAQHHDTTFLHFIAAHLKAGNTSTDRNERALATEAVMAYLDTINAVGNYFIMGDFNLYSMTEPAFIDLVAYSPDPSLNFQDPVNRVGVWSNSSSYSDVHTQSTRTSSGCASGGGMDDRFDFILCRNEVLNNSFKVRYIPGTYHALGQDGNRFNGSINSPTNNSVPFFVANALYDMSDHLPVLMDLEITLPPATNLADLESNKLIGMNNPVKDYLYLHLSPNIEGLISIKLLDTQGKLIKEIPFKGQIRLVENLSGLKSGTYFISLEYKNKAKSVDKLIKI